MKSIHISQKTQSSAYRNKSTVSRHLNFNDTEHAIDNIEYLHFSTFSFSNQLPALTVMASTNCSRHDEVPTTSDTLAFRSNLSTVLYIMHD